MNQPEALVDEIVSALPEELFKSSTTTFCDPAMGKGDYLVGVAKRLLKYGHTRDNILSRLYGFEDQEIYLQNCLRKTPLKGANLEVMSYDDILAGGIVKKFDCVIGNPPYQATSGRDGDNTRLQGTRNLYDKFFVEMFAPAPVYAVVIPSFWVGRPTHKIRKIVSGADGATQILDTTDHFRMGDSVPTCTVIKVGPPTQTITIQTKTGEHIKVDRNELVSLTGTATSTNMISKLRQLPTLDRVHFQSNLYTRSIPELTDDTTPYPFIDITGPKNQPLTTRYTTKKLPQKHDDTARVIVSWNASKTSIGAVKYTDLIAPISGSCVAFPCKTINECVVLTSYLTSKLVTFIAKMVKTSATNNKATFSNIPQVDLTRSWTDQELYAHFNLTQEEIDLIEATV